ncbi:hypothetical protein OUZ56_027629 [Daphnia magna]|uniref:Uncharacterized protein n=1 Tax=Daphnia magna TaxID=35525 RepID=A0ABR0B1G1_9CRUS|nr:hypothetical protein OUZ56_027629 [Daphnia magna]
MITGARNIWTRLKLVLKAFHECIQSKMHAHNVVPAIRKVLCQSPGRCLDITVPHLLQLEIC